MKTIFIHLIMTLLICVTTTSCKKSDGPPRTDNSRYYIKTRVNKVNGGTYSYLYEYSNGALSSYTLQSIQPGGSVSNYTYTASKTASTVTESTILNGAANLTNTHWLTGINNVDSSRSVRANGTINSNAKYYYNSRNEASREIIYYSTYTNDVKRFWSDGNNMYSIYDFTHLATPAQSYRDSLVYEYYTDKPNNLNLPTFGTATGNANKNLVKKRTAYQTLNGNAIRNVYDYQYQWNDKGLVTQQIWVITDYPGMTISRRDTTTYTYVTF